MRKIKKLMKKLNYFIHNTSIIDQNVKIDLELRFGIGAT